jgi:hypothetical protein
MAWLMRLGFDGWANIVTVIASTTDAAPRVAYLPIFFTEISPLRHVE